MPLPFSTAFFKKATPFPAFPADQHKESFPCCRLLFPLTHPQGWHRRSKRPLPAILTSLAAHGLWRSMKSCRSSCACPAQVPSAASLRTLTNRHRPERAARRYRCHPIQALRRRTGPDAAAKSRRTPFSRVRRLFVRKTHFPAVSAALRGGLFLSDIL